MWHLAIEWTQSEKSSATTTSLFPVHHKPLATAPCCWCIKLARIVAATPHSTLDTIHRPPPALNQTRTHPATPIIHWQGWKLPSDARAPPDRGQNLFFFFFQTLMPPILRTSMLLFGFFWKPLNVCLICEAIKKLERVYIIIYSSYIFFLVRLDLVFVLLHIT